MYFKIHSSRKLANRRAPSYLGYQRFLLMRRLGLGSAFCAGHNKDSGRIRPKPGNDAIKASGILRSRSQLVEYCQILSKVTTFTGVVVGGRHHIWIKFVVGSRPCSKRFFSVYSGLPSPKEQHLQIPIGSVLLSRDCASTPRVIDKQKYVLFFTFLKLPLNPITEARFARVFPRAAQESYLYLLRVLIGSLSSVYFSFVL